MKKDFPLISIIIPVYNVERYLRECLDSVLAQTYQNLEIILIDDGSQDNSGKICDEYAAKDGRVQVIHQPNQGVSVARNAGLQAARGEYIGFVDSDDYIKPDMYQILLSTALQNHADIAMCRQIVVRPQGEELVNSPYEKEYTYPDNISWLKDLMTYPFFSHVIWNKLFKKQRIRDIRFNQLSGSGEDFEFLLDFLNYPLRVVYTPQPLYYYVFRENSATHQKIIRFFGNQYLAWKRAIKIARKMQKQGQLAGGTADWIDTVYRERFIFKAYLFVKFIILFDVKNEYKRDLRELRYMFYQLQKSPIIRSCNVKCRIWIHCFGKFPKITIGILRLPGLRQLLSYYMLHR